MKFGFPTLTTEFEERDRNTVLLMHFNEGNGGEAKDSSAFEHHGLVDGATWEEAHRSSRAWASYQRHGGNSNVVTRPHPG